VSRLPLVPADPDDEITAEVFDVFRREGREPIVLYRALANAPRMLRAYSTLARGLRYDAKSPRALRELCILRTAQLVGSEYEWSHHRVMAEKAGVSPEKLATLAAWRDSDVFDDAERAVLRATEEIHAIALSDDAFADLERALGREQTVEIVLLASFYESVARMIQALGIEVEPEYASYREGLR
jgi:4-carboxymuconolactone decarboxylase